MNDAIYQPGEIIDGRYRLEKALGRGGFATVYQAHHLNLDRPAALKILEPVAPSISQRFLQRFTTEARIAANLDHPNVVRIFDFGVIERDDRPYIAMELLDGRDLEEQLVAEGPMEPKRAKRLFEGVLDALRVGHERGIIHKDLKPANLFMVRPGTTDERLVVLDYGIARLEEDDNPRLTEEGTYTGTPPYMPPEYIQRREVFPASDVYQVGLIFIEAMTGQPVITGATRIAMMVAHVEGKHRVPDDFGDSPLGATLLKSIAIDPAGRYPDAGAMLDAVRIAEVSTDSDFTLPAMTVEDERLPTTDVEQGRDAGELPPKEKSNLPIFALIGGIAAMACCVVVTAAAGVLYFSVLDRDFKVRETSEASNAPKESPGTPAVPSVSELQEKVYGSQPGSVGAAREMWQWVYARYCIAQPLSQFGAFEETYRRSGGWDGTADAIVLPQAESMLQIARQNIDASIAQAPRRVKLERAAKEVLKDIGPVSRLTAELNAYKARRGWEKDGGEKGERLTRRLRAKLKLLRKSWRTFSPRVDHELRQFVKRRQDRYASTDPFLLRATRALGASHDVILKVRKSPLSAAADASLKDLERTTDDLAGYSRDHADSLAQRYSASHGAHGGLLEELRETRKLANEVRSAVRDDEDARSQKMFLLMQLTYNLQRYNLLLRW